MTKTEYSKLLKKARNRAAPLTRSAMEEMKKVYEAASEDVAVTIRNAPAGGLQQRGAEIIQTQLQRGVGAINTELSRVTESSMARMADIHAAINERQILDIVSKSIAKDVITEPGVRNMLVAVNNRLVANLINKQLQDGFRLSDRVFAAASDYQEQITRLVNSGVAQGRSTIDIAKDVQQYTRGGIEALGPDYQGARFGKRVARNVDWRALRLVRSEISQAMQESALQQGEANPASTHVYDWVLTPGRQHWNCECETNQANSPYEADNVPGYPHSHCSCRLEPRLRDEDEMIDMWADWINGKQVPEINSWYENYYRQVNG